MEDNRKPITHILLQQICEHVSCFVKGSYRLLLFQGLLFIFQDGTSVSSNYFNTVLKAAISLVHGSAQGYSSHSFRIGAATHCSMKGYSKDIISTMGRWHSNAVNKYIRVPSFKV